MRYAVLGPAGTFSELAFLRYAANSDDLALYCPSIEGVFDALSDTDGAIVPIENTLDGYISQTIDQLYEKDARIVAELIVPVQYAFLLNGNTIADIKRLYVQFAAMGQCQTFLKSLPESCARVLTASNMESRERVDEGVKGDGAIVPIHRIDDFQGFVRPYVTDSVDNATRFVVVRKSAVPASLGTVRVAILVTPTEDRPGLLYDILSIFKSHQVSLSAILSRPTRTEMGSYRFYLEMVGTNVEQSGILQAIHDVESRFSIRVLGIYPAVFSPMD